MAEGAVDEGDFCGHERAASLAGQRGGRRIVGEQRPEFEPGRVRLEMREILQGKLCAAEDMNRSRFRMTDDLDRHRFSVADCLSGCSSGVLHTFFSVSGRIETRCKITKNSADHQGKRRINSHKFA